MIFTELNETNWLMFAIKNYDNPLSVTYEDFEEDLKKFKYVKRLLRRYETTGEMKTHLILNHLITIYNVINDSATLLLFYKIESKYWPILKSFMIYLDRLPEGIDNTNVDEVCLKNLKMI